MLGASEGGSVGGPRCSVGRASPASRFAAPGGGEYSWPGSTRRTQPDLEVVRAVVRRLRVERRVRVAVPVGDAPRRSCWYLRASDVSVSPADHGVQREGRRRASASAGPAWASAWRAAAAAAAWAAARASGVGRAAGRQPRERARRRRRQRGARRRIGDASRASGRWPECDAIEPRRGDGRGYAVRTGGGSTGVGSDSVNSPASARPSSRRRDPAAAAALGHEAGPVGREQHVLGVGAVHAGTTTVPIDAETCEPSRRPRGARAADRRDGGLDALGDRRRGRRRRCAAGARRTRRRRSGTRRRSRGPRRRIAGAISRSSAVAGLVRPGVSLIALNSSRSIITRPNGSPAADAPGQPAP